MSSTVTAGKFTLGVSISKKPTGFFLIRLSDGGGSNTDSLEHALQRLHRNGIIRMGVVAPNVRKYPDPDGRTWWIADAATKDALLEALAALAPEPLCCRPYAEWLRKYEAREIITKIRDRPQ